MNEVKVIICCDTEPDQPFYGGLDYKVHFGSHKWRGIEEGIPEMKEIANSVEDPEGHNAKITWFLRSDDQMKILYDDPAWIVRNFRSLWKELESEGDEIGWHPHLWRWNERIESWYPELEDKGWIENCLEEGFKSFSGEFRLMSSRMCWNFHNNITMNKINELGIAVDISAMPGQKFIKYVYESAYFPNYDWEGSPEHPYFPSHLDYRREADKNGPPLNILEIPLTNFKISLPWRIKRNLNKLFKPKGGYPLGKRNPLKITGNPDLFKLSVKEKFFESKQRNCSPFLVSFFHADEVLPGTKNSNLINVKKNFENILEASEKYGVPFRFITAKEAALEFLNEKEEVYRGSGKNGKMEKSRNFPK